jgi:hypothetical protein
MDFLALTPAGVPHPGAQFDIGGKTFVADSNGVIHNVPANLTHGVLNCGTVPLTPAGWTDPRMVITVKY